MLVLLLTVYDSLPAATSLILRSFATTTAMGGLTAFAASFARLFGRELVRRAFLVGSVTAFAASFAGLFGRELVRRAFLVGGMTAFAASFAGLFGRELVRRAFLVGGFSALTGDFPLFLLVHGGKSPIAFLSTLLPIFLIAIIWHELHSFI
jgi:uncharacterized membrane protein